MLFLSDPCAHGSDYWVALSLSMSTFLKPCEDLVKAKTHRDSVRVGRMVEDRVETLFFRQSRLYLDLLTLFKCHLSKTFLGGVNQSMVDEPLSTSQAGIEQ